MLKATKTILSIVVIGGILGGCTNNNKSTGIFPPTNNKEQTSIPINIEDNSIGKKQDVAEPDINIPMSKATERITKKPFGIYITPKNSPIEDDIFTGYHTGVDFEIFKDEKELKVPVRAICSGPLRIKRWVSGYGGVIIQDCTLLDKAVTVLYGHINLDSVMLTKGSFINTGEPIAFLGKGKSKETDGERKHLHLGIYKGSKAEYRGYVVTESELTNWFDFTKIQFEY